MNPERARGAHAESGVEDELGALVRGIVGVARKRAGVAALAVAFEPIAAPREAEEEAVRSTVREPAILLVAGAEVDGVEPAIRCLGQEPGRKLDDGLQLGAGDAGGADIVGPDLRRRVQLVDDQVPVPGPEHARAQRPGGAMEGDPAVQRPRALRPQVGVGRDAARLQVELVERRRPEGKPPAAAEVDRFGRAPDRGYPRADAGVPPDLVEPQRGEEGEAPRKLWSVSRESSVMALAAPGRPRAPADPWARTSRSMAPPRGCEVRPSSESRRASALRRV